MVEHGSVDWLEEGRPGQIMGEGDCFGFEGLLTGAPARATVVARRPTVLLCLSRDLYDRYLRELKDVELELHRLALRSISSPRHLGARRANS
jgi:CRP-like cAMP-binding protein